MQFGGGPFPDWLREMTMNIKELNENWDLIIIGGGVTGAGILREAARMDLQVLLLEQNDFAYGTSSRSSKLVHGGLRYLKEGKPLLTRDSVVERERLLREAPGLVETLDFLIPIYKDYGPGKWLIKAGLSLYDLMAMNWGHTFYPAAKFSQLLPDIRQEKLVGGFRFSDAQVDDARLVLRLISEATASGAYALNYTSVRDIRRDIRGNVIGVTAEDIETGEARSLSTRALINATGSWAETLHPSPQPNLHLRPLRGSHLIFPSWVLPLEHAVSLVHPKDHRPVFAIPWEGVILFGTTDCDHEDPLSLEPAITPEEVSYLMEALTSLFPERNISAKDCLSSFAGIRPVLSKGKLPPSKESREHVVWVERGLVTITGGKLTTFRRLAWDALKAVRPFLPPTVQVKGEGEPIFSAIHSRGSAGDDDGISHVARHRLYGRYGQGAKHILETAAPKDLLPVPGTRTLWAELPYTAKHEQVRHLSDLLMRRVRIGLLTSEGGKAHIGRIRELCEPVLPWDENRWEEEIQSYSELWHRAYAVRGEG